MIPSNGWYPLFNSLQHCFDICRPKSQRSQTEQHRNNRYFSVQYSTFFRTWYRRYGIFGIDIGSLQVIPLTEKSYYFIELPIHIIIKWNNRSETTVIIMWNNRLYLYKMLKISMWFLEYVGFLGYVYRPVRKFLSNLKL